MMQMEIQSNLFFFKTVKKMENQKLEYENIVTQEVSPNMIGAIMDMFALFHDVIVDKISDEAAQEFTQEFEVIEKAFWKR